MKEYEDAASTCLSQAPASRSHRRRRLLLGSLVLVFAFMFTVGVGLSTGATRAQALESRGTGSFQTLAVSHKCPPHDQTATKTRGANGQSNPLTIPNGTGSRILP